MLMDIGDGAMFNIPGVGLEWGAYPHLFHPRFIVPIPTALYHTARNRVDITLISPCFTRRVILLKNGLISVKTE